MTQLDFTIHFHSPFLSSTGVSTAGFDSSVDVSQPVQESALKGLMRSNAATVLGISTTHIEEIFGSAKNPARWSWQVLKQTSPIATSERHRVAINSNTHTASDDALLNSRVAMLDVVRFNVVRTGSSATDDASKEEIILTAAARSIHAMGSQRRRGLGWVSITGGLQLTLKDLASLQAWREIA